MRTISPAKRRLSVCESVKLQMVCNTCGREVTGNWETKTLPSNSGLSIGLPCKFDCDNQIGQFFCYCAECYLRRPQVSSLQEKIAVLTSQLSEKNNTESQKEQALKNEKEIESLKNQIKSLENECKLLEKEVSQRDSQIESLKILSASKSDEIGRLQSNYW